MRCRSYLLATVSSLAIIGVANAQPSARGPVVAAPFSWTGFYVGVHGGGAWLDHKQTTVDPNGACNTGTLGPTTPSVCSIHKSGAAFGGFAGYNFQSGRIVSGLEIDGTWLNLKESRVFSPAFFVTDPLTLHTKVSWLATVRGRLGITMSPTLLYVTGGAAFGGVKSGWFDGSGPPVGLSVDKTQAGWVAGGGIEHAFASNWTARVEALYHDLGNVSTGPVSAAGQTYNTTFRHRVTTVRGAVALRW